MSYQNEKKIIGIVISDIHLGASKTEYLLFLDFLNKIKSGYFGKHMKTLIITGDCFDLCMKTPDQLRTIYSIYYEIMKEIQNLGIDIVFTLGNHEIEVFGNYDKEFIPRKKRFLKALKLGILKKRNVSQYILLTLKDGGLDVAPINTLKKLQKQTRGKHREFKCLVVHGFQFDSDNHRTWASRLFWGPLINSNQSWIKTTVNFLWNDVISSIRRIGAVSTREIIRELNRCHIKASKWEIECFIRTIQQWQDFLFKNRNKEYFTNIDTFVTNNHLSTIKQVIFGHSHKSEKKLVNNVMMVNSGAWQKTYKPPYVLVELNSLNRVQLTLKRYKISRDLRILRLYFAIVDFLETKIKELLFKEAPEIIERSQLHKRARVLNRAKNEGIIDESEFNLINEWRRRKKMVFDKTKGYDVKAILEILEILENSDINKFLSKANQIFRDIIHRKDKKGSADRRELLYYFTPKKRKVLLKEKPTT